ERLRRYQLAFDRSLHRTIHALFKGRKETDDRADEGSGSGADEPAMAVEPTIGGGDETKPTAAVDPRESPLPAAGGMEMPAEAETPPLVPRESRRPAESDVGPDDETKPTAAGGAPESRLPAGSAIGRDDETKPNPADTPRESLLPAAGAMGLPAGAG